MVTANGGINQQRVAVSIISYTTDLKIFLLPLLFLVCVFILDKNLTCG